mmetsp:Transcript_33434/g.99459  ORF Transcript_33434/g.99459 Transcript_33434/m.99459 type:complete len:218 (+) Transcript_33434:568-1221(+)
MRIHGQHQLFLRRALRDADTDVDSRPAADSLAVAAPRGRHPRPYLQRHELQAARGNTDSATCPSEETSRLRAGAGARIRRRGGLRYNCGPVARRGWHCRGGGGGLHGHSTKPYRCDSTRVHRAARLFERAAPEVQSARVRCAHALLAAHRFRGREPYPRRTCPLRERNVTRGASHRRHGNWGSYGRREVRRERITQKCEGVVRVCLWDMCTCSVEVV